MRHFYISFFLTMLLSMVSGTASAHNIAVANDDGVTIYYYWVTNNGNKELMVTYRGGSYDSYDNEYTGNVVIPSTVTYEGQSYSVTSIGDSAFRGCSGLTSVTIPNSVTDIGRSAFFFCSGLTSIDIPNSVTSIGDVAFYGCSGLTAVTIGNSVTSIGGWAFSNCSGLTSLTIPNSVTWIGEAAFYGCSGLTSIDIPNSVTSIGDYAFNGCSGLASITIGSSVTSIGGSAFYGCSGLTAVTIGNSVISIGSFAFYGCSSLNKVIVPDIAAWCKIAFSNSDANPLSYAHHLYSDVNTEITNLVIPNSVTSIGNYAFYSCSGLTSIDIPNSVTSIGAQAFSGCSGLTSVTIPNSVTSIGSSAFGGCSGLATVVVDLAFPPVISAGTFTDVANTILFVPLGSSSDYEEAVGWKDFGKIATIGNIDVNEDINTTDVTALYNVIFGTDTTTNPMICDIDGSGGDPNTTDVTALYNIIFGTAK